jgi:hypothetical protein
VGARTRLLAAFALVLVVAAPAACSRENPETAAAPSLPPASVAATPATDTTAPAQTTSTPDLSSSATPTPASTPTAPPPPAGPTPTAAPRNVGGLMIVDETWVGIIREAGGLRVRSAPRVEPGNIVGSVAEGTPVNVSGRVLNGQEAELGKGATWLIVGPNQYIYAGPGYVERIR